VSKEIPERRRSSFLAVVVQALAIIDLVLVWP
jgi:hypothetical protein